jgi:hypothetical protein
MRRTTLVASALVLSTALLAPASLAATPTLLDAPPGVAAESFAEEVSRIAHEGLTAFGNLFICLGAGGLVDCVA